MIEKDMSAKDLAVLEELAMRMAELKEHPSWPVFVQLMKEYGVTEQRQRLGMAGPIASYDIVGPQGQRFSLKPIDQVQWVKGVLDCIEIAVALPDKTIKRFEDASAESEK